MNWIDLTREVHADMPQFAAPWHARVSTTQTASHATEGRQAHELRLSTHVGTHMDAPSHFIAGGATTSDFSLDQLCGKAQLIRLTNPSWNFEIQGEFLEQKSMKPAPRGLIIDTGWGNQWNQAAYFESNPFLSLDAAHWITSNGIEIIGFDAPQLDSSINGRGSINDSPIHKLLLGQNIVQIENLCNLDKLPEGHLFDFHVFPIKLIGMDGAPVRAVARYDQAEENNYKS